MGQRSRLVSMQVRWIRDRNKVWHRGGREGERRRSGKEDRRDRKGLVVLNVTGAEADKTPERRAAIVVQRDRLGKGDRRRRVWHVWWRRRSIAADRRMSWVPQMYRYRGQRRVSWGQEDPPGHHWWFHKVCLMWMMVAVQSGRSRRRKRMENRSRIRIPHKQIEAEVGGDETRPLAVANRHRVDDLAQLIGEAG